MQLLSLSAFPCLHLRDQLATFHLPDIEFPSKTTHSKTLVFREEELSRLLCSHLDVLDPVGQENLLLAAIMGGDNSEAS